ncbi:MAG TPA: FAD-dependent oxidoreductase [Gemmatimonadales bacterium]|nr:FAD-dependent oxidoreductase [Gemmatimonadales bacterium]
MTAIVIGAGLAGLSAAWELRRAGADVVVLESERRVGGVVVTERFDGFVVEGGPDGFLAVEPDIQQLACELGLEHRLVDQIARGSMLWTGQRLESLAEGRAAQLLGIDLQGRSDDELDRGFRSFAGGMAEIVDALTAQLGPAVRTAQGVAGIAPRGAGGGGRGWRIAVSGGSVLEAGAIVLAVPAWVAARLLASIGVPGARELDGAIYYPSITVSLAYRAEQLTRALAGAGFVSAWESGAAVRACTYAWLKYPGRAPQGHALLRAFVGPVDGDPAAVAHAELAKIIGVSGAPVWARAFHWVRGLPRYRPGHAGHVAMVRERFDRFAPLDVAGAGFDGAGVSACVKSGREAAKRVLRRF